MNSKLSRSGLIALAVALAVASPANAHDPGRGHPEDGPPKAKLVVLSGARATADWYGRGAVSVSAPLCIVSSTGAFRLSILPSSGLSALTQSTSALIALDRDGALVASQSFDGSTPVTFTGRVDPHNRDCAGGGNARLTITLPEQSLASVTAGQYFDQLRLELEAI